MLNNAFVNKAIKISAEPTHLLTRALCQPGFEVKQSELHLWQKSEEDF